MMNLKVSEKTVCFSLLLAFSVVASAQQTVWTLDSCLHMAERNSHEMLMGKENVKAAEWNRKAMRTNYLPSLDAGGAYFHSSRELSLLSGGQKDALSSMGTSVSGMLSTAAGSNATLATLLSGMDIPNLVSALNSAGQDVRDAFHTDTRNIYTGSLILTQPVYLGGRIHAANRIADLQTELAGNQLCRTQRDLRVDVEKIYWQTVSLADRLKLAESYQTLVGRFHSDVVRMRTAGVATKADELSMRVQLNEANMSVTRVRDGLSLSRMSLCRLCGQEITDQIRCADESNGDGILTPFSPNGEGGGDSALSEVWNLRPEIRQLDNAVSIYKENVKMVRSDFLPQVVAAGSGLISNPSTFNGYEKKFKGMWAVGIGVKVPVWHWHEGRFKVNAARARVNMAQYQLDDTKQLIELEVKQCRYRSDEARKRLVMARSDQEKADENLRYAEIGFREGVMPTSNVIEAQTAWLKAHSSLIDAQIELRMAFVELQHALGK